MRNKTISRKNMRWILALAALVFMIVWSGGFLNRKLAPAVGPGIKGTPLPPDAETVTVEIKEQAPLIDIAGTVESEEIIHLSSRISAYVSQVFVSAGDAVKKGDVLVTLDDREIKQQRDMAQADAVQAEIEFNRTRELFEKKVSTDQQMTAARATYDRAKSALERMNVMMTYAQIIAPIDGIVTDRRIEAGDLANPGEPLLAVYDQHRMRITVPVPVRLADRLSVGEKTTVTLDGFDDSQGTVTEVVAEIDPSSRTRQVRIRLQPFDRPLLPGTFGRVWVHDHARNSVVIPTSCVYTIGQLEMVQVVRENRLLRRLVRTGPSTDDSVEILSGLSGGEQILLQPIR
ncbi:MAG: efflux RND transporter periplasmic adaptor subunit [Kiritimatiellae bacterium]|nr:efflux RND transporter periplasmic adaptor subunit [Kiritimatiellia bacterium]MDD4736314.1 efflux RND transporter periplasmic adaptor subunit [Kiritimatiellia bacterium]